MAKKNSFAVIGGDRRQQAAAQSLCNDGYTVLTSGMENANFNGSVKKTNLTRAIDESEYVILPLPVTLDDRSLNAPMSDRCIMLSDELPELLKGKTVFCGLKQQLLERDAKWKEVKLFDYATRKDFAIRNAVPTGEGAIQIAMEEYDGTINGAKCLVAGFGRIGKVLAKMLYGLGADVSVSARKQEDLSWIELLGYNAVANDEIISSGTYEIIFNTVPYLIFCAQVLAKVTDNSLVIDLASKPGGVDFEAASRLGIKSIQALSLPGKVAPKTAGEIIKNTIYKIIEEGV